MSKIKIFLVDELYPDKTSLQSDPGDHKLSSEKEINSFLKKSDVKHFYVSPSESGIRQLFFIYEEVFQNE